MPTKPFRLATLLRIREQIRDDRLARLAEAEQAAAMVVQRIDEIDAESQEIQQHLLQNLRCGSVNVDRMLDAQRYDAILKADRDLAKKQLEQIEVEAAKRREALVVADRDVKVLEKLRDQQRERERNEEASRESRRFDEMALERFVRREVR